MSDTRKVKWKVPALGHKIGDVTNEPAKWVEECGLPAELVDEVKAGASAGAKERKR